MKIQIRIKAQSSIQTKSHFVVNFGKNHKKIIHNNNQTVVAVIYSKYFWKTFLKNFVIKTTKIIQTATKIFQIKVQKNGEIFSIEKNYLVKKIYIKDIKIFILKDKKIFSLMKIYFVKITLTFWLSIIKITLIL